MVAFCQSFSQSPTAQSPSKNASPDEAASLNATAAYNEMIHNCIKLGNVQQGEALLNNMEACGVRPDLLSFNLVLNSYAIDGDVERAARLLSAMLQHKIEPNDVTYATVCKVMAVRGLVAEIEAFMQVLRQHNVSLNVYFFGALISACGRCEPPDVPTAERAFKELVELGLRPQSVKKSLARVVGMDRASAMISHACQDKATIEKLLEAPAIIKSSFSSPSFDSPAYISPVACCRMGAPIMPMMPDNCDSRPAKIRLSF
eukprot:CAMPEP_0170580842 /NCGR_PEP_ID=MMETSP0224-20130122/6722_1 /TAXON_ID=285029 /ORGANISM="Togula jolla, Strain CCCM 725" /LENGTH=258 /DNA_ID=CAMNT_0010903939 /DNA_START=87 /DNA_END=863 /DNA_ORIENTATION=-